MDVPEFPKCPIIGRRHRKQTVHAVKATLELPEDLYHQLEAEAARQGISVNDLVNESLHRMLEEIVHPEPDSPDDQTSLHEAMKEYCGAIKGTPPDYASNPKYMEGFGE